MALFSRESEFDGRHDDNDQEREMIYGVRRVLNAEDEAHEETATRRARKAGSLGFKRTERRDEGGAYGRR